MQNLYLMNIENNMISFRIGNNLFQRMKYNISEDETNYFKR